MAEEDLLMSCQFATDRAGTQINLEKYSFLYVWIFYDVFPMRINLPYDFYNHKGSKQGEVDCF